MSLQLEKPLDGGLESEPEPTPAISGSANGQPRRKPGTFRVGDPRINRAGGPRRDGPSSDSAVPRLLRDLRHVYNRPKSKDKTQGQKMLRKLFEEHPEKFVYRLQRAEGEYRAVAKPILEEKEAATEVKDHGTERALEMVEKCLAAFGEQRAREDAEFAKRPNAAEIGATLQENLAAALQREAALRVEVKELRGRS